MRKRHRLDDWYRSLVSHAADDLEDAARVAKEIFADEGERKEGARLWREYRMLAKQIRQVHGSDAPSRKPAN